MISSFQNVNEEFYKQLYGALLPPTQVFKDYKNRPFTVQQKFGRSSIDYANEVREAYPMLIITPFTPTQRDSVVPDTKRQYGDVRDTDGDSIPDTVTRFYDSYPMKFRYELDVCTKDENQHSALVQWLESNFVYALQTNYFSFNSPGVFSTIWGDEKPGDIVQYDCNHIDDPDRNDGVRQSLYEFILYPFVFVKNPEDLALLRTINLGLAQADPVTGVPGSSLLTEDGSGILTEDNQPLTI